MRDIVRDARKRLNDLSREAAVQFESSVVHNRVSVRVDENDSLRQLLDVTEQAYNLENNRNRPDAVRQAAFGAAEDLNDHVDRLVEDVVARECAATIEDARGDWFDAAEIGEEVVEDAFNEACAWLADHPDAAERNEIDVDETVWGEEVEA